MRLKDKFIALMAMRKFVSDLSPDQAHLFHRIAARYQGDAIDFKATVLREFREGAAAAPSLPPEDLELRAAMGHVLGRESSAVPEMVAHIEAVWPDLQPQTRETVVSDIETAIAYRMAGGASEIALWKRILTMNTEAPRSAADLATLRQAAADTAYQAHDFGDATIDDHSGWEYTSPGDEWTRAIFIQPDDPAAPTDKGHFTVVFEPGTAVVREAYGILDGNMLGPTPPSPR